MFFSDVWLGRLILFELLATGEEIRLGYAP